MDTSPSSGGVNRDPEEEWQSNLNNWLAKRRQHLTTTTGTLSSAQLVTTQSSSADFSLFSNSDDSHNSAASQQRKIKTFAEMLGDRARAGSRIKYNLDEYITTTRTTTSEITSERTTSISTTTDTTSGDDDVGSSCDSDGAATVDSGMTENFKIQKIYENSNENISRINSNSSNSGDTQSSDDENSESFVSQHNSRRDSRESNKPKSILEKSMNQLNLNSSLDDLFTPKRNLIGMVSQEDTSLYESEQKSFVDLDMTPSKLPSPPRKSNQDPNLLVSTETMKNQENDNSLPQAAPRRFQPKQTPNLVQNLATKESSHVPKDKLVGLNESSQNSLTKDIKSGSSLKQIPNSSPKKSTSHLNKDVNDKQVIETENPDDKEENQSHPTKEEIEFQRLQQRKAFKEKLKAFENLSALNSSSNSNGNCSLSHNTSLLKTPSPLASPVNQHAQVSSRKFNTSLVRDVPKSGLQILDRSLNSAQNIVKSQNTNFQRWNSTTLNNGIKSPVENLSTFTCTALNKIPKVTMCNVSRGNIGVSLRSSFSGSQERISSSPKVDLEKCDDEIQIKDNQKLKDSSFPMEQTGPSSSVAPVDEIDKFVTATDTLPLHCQNDNDFPVTVEQNSHDSDINDTEKESSMQRNCGNKVYPHLENGNKLAKDIADTCESETPKALNNGGDQSAHAYFEDHHEDLVNNQLETNNNNDNHCKINDSKQDCQITNSTKNSAIFLNNSNDVDGGSVKNNVNNKVNGNNTGDNGNNRDYYKDSSISREFQKLNSDQQKTDIKFGTKKLDSTMTNCRQEQRVQKEIKEKKELKEKKKVISVSGRKHCASCNQELGRGRAAMVIESLSTCYHMECFRCSVCHVQLSKGFQGTDVRVHNNALHCQNCFSKDGLNFSRV